MGKYIVLVLCSALLGGCMVSQIDRSISKYYSVADQVELGNSKEQVLAILQPTQENLPVVHRKRPDKYFQDEVLVEIYYMRSGHQGDGYTTDDEFVPYLFHDGKLVGIGWEVLGGPKTWAGKIGDSY
jgi:hypothetical protein